MLSNILILLGISLLINIIIFVIAFILKSDKFTDITYALTFILLTVIALFQNEYNMFKIILAFLIFVWAIRLGGFLFIRINYFKKDKRFDGIRDNFFKFLGFFLLQGITVWVVLISTLLFFNINNISINFIFYIGIIIWIKGFLFETISDYQKFNFIKRNIDKNNFINKGLWKYSRHPNYYGEILCWVGIFIITSYTLYLSNIYHLIFGFISPLFIYFLLRYFSGIPILEKNSDKRFKGNKEYLKYKENTPMLIPYKIK
jgi:steroid 5-alpha reductase family enzyme